MKNKLKHGFTLLEILAVISIVIVLLGLVIGLSGVVNEKASETKARKDLVKIQQFVDDYKFEHGDFPKELRRVLPVELRYDPWGSTYVCNYEALKSDKGMDASVIQYIFGSMGRDSRPGFRDVDDNNNGEKDGHPGVEIDDKGRQYNGYIPDGGELGFGDDITNIR